MSKGDRDGGRERNNKDSRIFMYLYNMFQNQIIIYNINQPTNNNNKKLNINKCVSKCSFSLCTYIYIYIYIYKVSQNNKKKIKKKPIMINFTNFATCL